MKDSIEPQKDLADETTYSVEEAKEMGAFVEDALSFTDARESVDDFAEGGVIKGRVYDVFAPTVGLASIEIGIETPDGKAKATGQTNTAGEYYVEIKAPVGTKIAASYQGNNYGISIKVFLLEKEVMEENVYLFQQGKDDPTYWSKAIGNVMNNKQIASWTGSASDLWKSIDGLGVSTVDKIYLCRALAELDPQASVTFPDINKYRNTDPEVIKAFVAQVDATVDREHRLPSKTEIVNAVPGTKDLPTVVVGDVFAHKLTEKPDLKQAEILQLVNTWDAEVKKKTIKSVVRKEPYIKVVAKFGGENKS